MRIDIPNPVEMCVVMISHSIEHAFRQMFAVIASWINRHTRCARKRMPPVMVRAHFVICWFGYRMRWPHMHGPNKMTSWCRLPAPCMGLIDTLESHRTHIMRFHADPWSLSKLFLSLLKSGTLLICWSMLRPLSSQAFMPWWLGLPNTEFGAFPHGSAECVHALGKLLWCCAQCHECVRASFAHGIDVRVIGSLKIQDCAEGRQAFTQCCPVELAREPRYVQALCNERRSIAGHDRRRGTRTNTYLNGERDARPADEDEDDLP